MNLTIGYVRCSSDKQDHTIDMQPDDIISYCKFAKYEIHPEYIFIDKAVSGRRPIAERPEGKKLMELVKSGQVKRIIAIKLDRVFRDLIDGAITKQVFDAYGVDLIIIEDGNVINTSTAIGKALYHMRLTMNQLESDQASERTSAIMQYLKKNKRAYARIPYGFNNVNGELVENQGEMAVVKSIFEAYHNGVSLGQIARDLSTGSVPTKENGKWHPSTIKKIIENPIYESFLI